ncbi:MAG: potassium channel family protein [Clostridium sp.]
MKDLEFTENERAEWVYDALAGIMAIVAIVTVMLSISHSLTEKEAYYINIADNIIYLIFVSDYFFRLIISKNKKKFFINNIIDLIAILPYGAVFSFKYENTIKLVRVITYLFRLIEDIHEIVFTSNLIYALGITIVITIVGSIAIYIVESKNNSGMKTYGDALWWSIVTVTTVGYGDITIVTSVGRIVASILMITGIGFLSMLTSTMSTYFFHKYAEKKIPSSKDSDSLDISMMSNKDKKNIRTYYDFLCSKYRR